MKKCAFCQDTKPITEFHKNSRSKDGLHSYCKSCNALKARKYQKTPKGKKSIQKAVKKYFQTYKGKQKLKEYQKKYYQTDKGKAALRRGINKKIGEGYYRYGKGAIPILKQGAKKRDIEFDITSEQLEQWWLTTKDSCEYCGISQDDFIKLRDFIIQYDGNDWEIIKFKRFFKTDKHKTIRWMTIDRVDNTKGYRIDNIVKSCWICNSLKSNFFNSLQMKQIAPEIISKLLMKVKNV